ncbi:MAG: deoxyribodipyrimidine photo-lyase [Alphaproteobacteria bacterium]|nr:MAG: deoxyribodipyrimidine photo-lyase [Alphaproteobacteria bacterium]
MRALVWFRNDLRINDNKALNDAILSGKPVIGIYIHDTHDSCPQSLSPRKLGGAASWFLDKALRSFKDELQTRRIPLICKRGNPEMVLAEICEDYQISSVFWGRRYSPKDIQQDIAIKAQLNKRGITVASRSGFLLYEPWAIKNKSSGPFKVFTPFWRTCLSSVDSCVQPFDCERGGNQDGLGEIPTGSVDDLSLVPMKATWTHTLAKNWDVSEKAAQTKLEQFCLQGLNDYAQARNFPHVPRGTSRLSPYLRFGLISPRQCWWMASQQGRGLSLERFLAELGWREFSYHLLYHMPDLSWKNVNPHFDHFPWKTSDPQLACWQQGRTGIPFIDAGMRQLWQTGWMHNRVRMVVASFLTKHMRIHWRCGEEWFWDTLVDADPASNASGWQWVAGSGADAAPYFRVFNPVLQSQKFDPQGDYIREFVPELASLSATEIHTPHQISPEMLRKKGVTLGDNYPLPVIDLHQGRLQALSSYAHMKSTQLSQE